MASFGSNFVTQVSDCPPIFGPCKRALRGVVLERSSEGRVQEYRVTYSCGDDDATVDISADYIVIEWQSLAFYRQDGKLMGFVGEVYDCFPIKADLKCVKRQ